MSKDDGGLLCKKCRYDLVMHAIAIENGLASVWCQERGNVLVGRVTAGRFLITDVHLQVSPQAAAYALEPVAELVRARAH